MRGPLAVRVSDGETTLHVTEQAAGLAFSRSAYGGDVDLTCRVTVPRATFTDLGPQANVEVFDARSGALVWSGDLDHPGETAGASGEAYEVQAFGGAARLQAVRKSLGYVVRDLDGWEKSNRNTVKGAVLDTGDTGDDDGDEPMLRISASEGDTVDTDWEAEYVYRDLRRVGLYVGRASADVVSGRHDTDYTRQLRTGTAIDDMRIRDEALGSTEVRILNGGRGGNNPIPLAHNMVSFRVRRNGTNRTANKTDWHEFTNVLVRQALVDRYGTDITDGYGGDVVTMSEVIEDMLGRNMCPKVDPDKVTIGPGIGYALDNLSWLDGVTMGDALVELRQFEPRLWWAVYGDTAIFDTWHKSNPRYVIPRGQISLPGQDVTLCNRVVVSWTNWRGRDRTTVVTAVVEGLDHRRDAEPVTLPDGTGSRANAKRAGEQALEETNEPPRAGTALIDGPVFDQHLGCLVWPHEILPGHAVVEQETGTVYRLTEMTYSDDDAAATLTLGEPAWSTEQVLARLRRVTRRRRRR